MQSPPTIACIMSQFNSAGEPIAFIRVRVPLKGGFHIDKVQLKIVEPRVVVVLTCLAALAVRWLNATRSRR